MTPGTRKWLERGRRAAMLLALVAGIAVFGWVVDQQYAIGQWLFWRYAEYWLATLVVGLASLSLGHLIVIGILRRPLPALEHYAIAFAFGVFAFEMLMFLGGTAHLYGTAWFFLMPIIAGAPGLRSLWRFTRRYARHLRASRARRPALGWAGYAAVAFGCAGLAMVYFLILTPHNVSFDARWMHEALAENIAAAGGIDRAPEANNFVVSPHFGSYLYAWAFLLPRSLLWDRMELCQHLAFFNFTVVTLVFIPAAVRRLVPRADPRVVWAARFLFPGVLLYDSNVNGGGDHLAAMWAIPILLLLFRAWRDLNPRYSAALGVALAGGTLTKYTATVMHVPLPVLAVVVRGLWLAVQAARGKLAAIRRGNWYRGVLAAGGTTLLLTTPFWLRNFIWYGDPFYPTLGKHFHHRPWPADATYLHRLYMDTQRWHNTNDMAGLVKSLKVLFTWSFVPNDWPQFHGAFPVIGSLFSLLILTLPFLRKTGRIWFIVLWVHVGIFTWYWVNHQDRYLQAILPLMIAATAAIIILLWRSGGRLVQGALCGLVALQVIWGGDTYFIPTHAMAGSPIARATDLLASGFHKNFKQRFDVQSELVSVGEHLPKHAKVLLHDFHGSLGVNRASIQDTPLWQYGISYTELDSFKGVYDLLHGMGITHVFFKTESWAKASLASDLLFYGFVERYGEHPQRVGGGTLSAMPARPPSGPFNDQVLVVCRPRYQPGMYRLADLRVPDLGPARTRVPQVRERASTPAEALTMLPRAGFAVVDSGCAAAANAVLSHDFMRIATRDHGRESLWLRR